MNTAKTILIVDDEQSLCAVFAALLKQHGYKALTAQSAKDALHLLATEQVDVLITDLNMPEMDGRALIQAVHANGKELPTILLTGMDAASRGALDDLKIDAILTKPLQRGALMATIASVLDKNMHDTRVTL